MLLAQQTVKKDINTLKWKRYHAIAVETVVMNNAFIV
jgi:hypothetical protein